MVTVNPSTIGSSGILSNIVSTKVLIFFFSILLLGTVYTAITTKDINSAVIDTGKSLLTPTLSLQQESLKIISQGGLIAQITNNGLLKMWKVLLELWFIINPFYVILIYLRIFSFISAKIILWNDAMSTSSFLIALLIFFGLSMIYLSHLGESIWSPFLAFKDFWNALGYIIEPVKKVATTVINN